LKLKLFTIALAPLLLWGCATSTATTGSDFISAVVPHIKRGVTTSSQLLRWLGEPYSKEPVSANTVLWLYTWVRPTANMAVVPFGHRNIGTSGYMKTLWLVIKDDVVVNYTYEEGLYERHTRVTSPPETLLLQSSLYRPDTQGNATNK